jgi:MSHA biogenesis protein MshL
MNMNRRNDMQRWMTIAMIAVVAGCADLPKQGPNAAQDAINKELERAVSERKPVSPDAVSRALLPPLVVEMPRADTQKPETRFDLSVNNAPAGQVFMAIVSGTRHSMVLHPEVKGEISVNLKDVSVTEALDTLRDLYGFDYTMQGNRIVVLPAALQTRIFQVNYLQAQRRGQTETRVSSGSISDGSASPGSAAPGAVPVPTTGPTGGGGTRAAESTRVTTSSNSDFWGGYPEVLVCHPWRRRREQRRGQCAIGGDCGEGDAERTAQRREIPQIDAIDR